MNVVRAVIVFCVMVVVAVLAISNSETLVSFILFTKKYDTVRLVFLLLYSFLFGALSVFVFAFASEIGLRREIGKMRKECTLLNEELNALRNLALGPEPVRKENR